LPGSAIASDCTGCDASQGGDHFDACCFELAPLGDGWAFVLLALAVAAKDWVYDPSNLTFALTFGAVYAK
jgi:hypothetical protein